MATKTIITGYETVQSVLPSDIINLEKLTELGGSVVEEFTVQVQRAKLETDHLTKFQIPADKAQEFCGGAVVDYVDGKWQSTPVKKEDHEITEEIEVADPIETFGLDEADPLFSTKRQILQAERDAQLAKEAEQKAAQDAAAMAAKQAAEDALTAKAIAVKALQKKNKKLAVADALMELQAKSEK